MRFFIATFSSHSGTIRNVIAAETLGQAEIYQQLYFKLLGDCEYIAPLKEVTMKEAIWELSVNRELINERLI